MKTGSTVIGLMCVVIGALLGAAGLVLLAWSFRARQH